MSYVTTLYAIDRDALRSAIGSKDLALLARVRRKCFNDSLSRKAAGNLLRIELDEESAILLNGRRAKIEEVRQAVKELTASGDRVRMAAQDSRARPDLAEAIFDEMKTIGETVGRMPSYETCAKEDLWWEDDEDAAEGELAVRRLIFGDVSIDDSASDVAYALQNLCRVVGTELDSGDMLGDLSDLQIDSPLCKWRMPVDIPQPDDFPFISYLSAEEVTAEAARLNSLDMSFPEDDDVEAARKALLRCLAEAKEKNLAVVAFYY